MSDELGPNVENVMHHPERWTFDWFYKRHDMEKADNRFYRETVKRAAELHEGCQMPMEQARALAASEALGRMAEAAGMVSLLDNGAASCVYSDGCHGVCQEHLERFVALVRAKRDPEMERLRVDLDDYLRHVIDMTKGEHYFDVVRENGAALLKRLQSVLGPNVEVTGLGREE